jgi:uncharacterized protein YecE (DUF72 family)
VKYHIGCSGWFYWHWKGLFYPEDLPTHRWFKHYVNNFKTVELNAPFYRWPKDITVKGWVRQASPRFRYCVKVNREITHERKMEGTAELVRSFYSISSILGPKMGCFLFQLPPSFKYSKENLDRVIEQLDPTYRNAVEFRHKSWWDDFVFDTFRQRGLIFCSVSGPRLPDAVVVTSPDLYIRFHGKDRWYRYNYSGAELEEWATKIRRSGAQAAWIYFNNDREGHAIRNGRKLKRLLSSSQERVGRTPKQT